MVAKKTAAASPTAIELPPLNIQRIDVPIVGDGGLISHAWSKKAKEQMLAKQMKKANVGKTAKDPWIDFCESLYWLGGMPEAPTEADVEGGRFGFPSIAFKAAAITAVTTIGALTKVAARQAFHIAGELVPLIGPPPSMREDMARVGMGTADIRFRGEFKPWGAILPVEFNANVLSAEQVVNLIHAGGFGVGIGDWRPEKDGVSGRFHVATGAEIESARAMTEYRWKPNVPSMWTKLDAQAIGKEIEQLEEEHQHSLSPEEIVRAAQDERSALHPAFEWNDAKAAAHYRIDQARKLVSLIDVVFVKADQSETQVRAFMSVEAPSGRGYVSTVHALNDPDLRQQVVQRAWIELDAWKQRYAELSELGKLFSAIDKARPHPKGKKPPK